MAIFLILMERLSKAIATFSFYYSWKNIMVAIGIYSCLSIVLGWTTGFLVWRPQSGLAIARIMVTSLIAPAIVEELFFRVILLPTPTGSLPFETYLVRSWFSLCLFIIYHPLNAITFFPQGRIAFFNPVFLTLATALGIICTWSYWYTGSLWLPVIVHWLTVVLWLSCFGGSEKLDRER